MTRWITKAAGVNAAELAEVLETAARELRLLTSTGLRLWFGYQASPYPEGDGMQAVVRAESEGAALAILGDGWRVYELVPEGVPGVIAYGPTPEECDFPRRVAWVPPSASPVPHALPDEG